MINKLRKELEEEYGGNLEDNILLEHTREDLDKDPYTVDALCIKSKKNPKISFSVISFQDKYPKEIMFRETSFYVVVEDPQKLEEFIEKMYFNKKYTLEECIRYCQHLLKN